MKKVCVTADDFGLTRENTRTILEGVDQGSISRVSVIPNGYAVDEALREWRLRAERLSLSVHLNLTEGKALSDPGTIPHLAHVDGTFRYSPATLLLATVLRGRELKEEMRREIGLQVARIRESAGTKPLFVDGHQHVHMIPMVFDVIRALHAADPVAGVRLTREPFFLPAGSPFAYVGIGGLRHIVLNLLAWRARKRASAAGMPAVEFFLGSLMSGRQTLRGVEAGLLEARRLQGDSVEIGMHPGEASREELSTWHGDRAWHASAWRTRERVLVSSPGFRSLLCSYEDGTIPSRGTRSLEILRFIVAGSITNLAGLILLYTLTDLLGIWYLVSAIISYPIVTAISFLLQKFWTFSHRELARTKAELATYVANNVGGTAFALLGLYLLVEYAHLWYLGAQVLVILVVAVWNFFIYKLVIFKKRA